MKIGWVMAMTIVGLAVAKAQPTPQEYSTQEEAQKACGADRVVWVNDRDGSPVPRSGRPDGGYMCRIVAVHAGRPWIEVVQE